MVGLGAADERAGNLRFPLFAAGIDLAIWGLLALIMLLIVPRHREIFADFGVQLPGLSRAVLDASDWLGGRAPGQAVPGIVWAAMVVVVMTTGVSWAFRWRGMRPLAWLLFVLWTLAPIAAIVVIMVAMFTPLAEMIGSLQEGKM